MLKKYLQGMMRRKVNHPTEDGVQVRVEDVSRDHWSFRHKNKLETVWFEKMSHAQVMRVLTK